MSGYCVLVLAVVGPLAGFGLWALLDWNGRASWAAFRLGYMTALDDHDRTGLRPTHEDTKERSAARAFRRYHVARGVADGSSGGFVEGSED